MESSRDIHTVGGSFAKDAAVAFDLGHDKEKHPAVTSEPDHPLHHPCEGPLDDCGEEPLDAPCPACVNIVKLTSSAWFQNMDRGLVAFTKDTGVKATQTGPAQATAEGQVSIIENLIPQKPTAIGVDPNSEQALEGVLGRAQKGGHLRVRARGATVEEHGP